jgi:ABC-type branched-subunit amino acid transport system substrate-binding protein
MRTLVPAALAALLVTSCATTRPAPPPPPPPGGLAPAPVSTAPSAAAASELSRLRALPATTPPARVAESFEKLARTWPGSAEAPEALDEAARAWMRAKQPSRASASWAELLSRYPLSPRADEARVRYGLAEIEAGRPKLGLPTLQSVYDQTPEARRGNLALRIAEAAEAAQNWPLAARWRAEASRWLPRAEGERQIAATLAIAATRMSPQEVEAFVAELPKDSPVAAVLSARAVARTRAAPGVIGVAVPLSGKFKAWGEAILQGVALAVPEGGPVRVVSRDTRGEPDGAAEAIQQLAAEGAVAILGGVTNAEAQRAAAAAQQEGVPLLSLSKVDGVTGGRPYVFRLMLTARAQAQALAELAVQGRNLRQAVILYPEIAYGTELKGAFAAEVEARGGSVVRSVGYEADRTNFAPLVKELVGRAPAQVERRADWKEIQKNIVKEIQDPYRRARALEKARKELAPQVEFDVVFVPDFARTVTLLAPALAAEDVVTACDPDELAKIQKVSPWVVKPVLLLGGNGWDDPAIVEKAGRYVECAVFVDGFFAGSERPDTKRFVEAFQKAYARSPSILEASAHDAAGMVAAAMASGAGGRTEMRDALAAQRPYPGATGDVSFDAQGEPVRSLFILTVDHGAIREMRPGEITGLPALAPSPAPSP